MSTLPEKPLSRIERYLEYIALNAQPSPTGTYRKETFNELGFLTSVELYGYEMIGVGAFKEQPDLTSVIIPNTVKTINLYAFDGCYSLKSIKLPIGLKTIDSLAFRDCALENVEFPETILEMGQACFRGCANLETVTFKGTPTNINSTTFMGCAGLTTINVPWDEGDIPYAPWGATNATINYNYTGA